MGDTRRGGKRLTGERGNATCPENEPGPERPGLGEIELDIGRLRLRQLGRRTAFHYWGLSMGGLSLWHWLVVIAVVALLFGGKGKISGVMGDFAKGIKAFKSGMKDDDEADAPPPPPPQVSPPAPQPKGAETTTAGEQPAHDRR